MKNLKSELAAKPIIAAVKDDQGLKLALASDCRIIFLLYGNICELAEHTKKIKAAGKTGFVHADLVDGLGSRDISARFIREAGGDGLISTKPAIIKAGREQGLLTVQRFFIIDSMALENCLKYMTAGADMIEVLPGTMPKIIQRITNICPVPVIAGGLIADREDAQAALNAGASGISATSQALWRL